MIRWWSLVLLCVGLAGCASMKGCARDAAASTISGVAQGATTAVIPPPAPKPAPTGDKTADALAEAQWRLSQAEASAASARQEIKTLREEQDRERQATYQRWIYGIAIGAFILAAASVALGFIASALAKPMFGVAAGFVTLGVLCITVAAAIPYFFWVAVGGGVLLLAGLVTLLVWALRRSDGALGRVSRGVDAFTEKAQPAVVEGLLGTLRTHMHDPDKTLIRQHRARRQAKAHIAGPGNPRG